MKTITVMFDGTEDEADVYICGNDPLTYDIYGYRVTPSLVKGSVEVSFSYDEQDSNSRDKLIEFLNKLGYVNYLEK